MCLCVYVFMCLCVLNQPLKASNWTYFTPEPCSHGDNTEWKGPFEYLYCPGFGDVCYGCCYKLVYYERFNSNGRYEINFVGLFWVKDDDTYLYDCDGCATPFTILNNGWYELIRYRSRQFLNNPTTFADSLYDDQLNQYVADVYYSANCTLSNGTNCGDEQERCCKHTYEAFTSLNGNYKRVVDGGQWIGGLIFAGPECPNSPYCQGNCNDFLLAPEPNFCEIEECNYGDFFPLSSDLVSVPGCPETCKIKINYWYREVSGPNCPPYIDLMLDNVEFFGDCSGCTMSIQDLYSYTISWLLKYGGIELAIGDCYEYYRTIDAMCWETRENKLFMPCWDNSVCCWSIYKVCRLGKETYTYEKLYGSNPPTDNCETFSRPCVYVCDVTPSPKIGTEDNSSDNDINTGLMAKVIPNPNDGTAIISVNGSDNGKYILKLYNNKGDELYVLNFEKKTYNHSIQLNLSDYISGKYLFKIYVDNKCIIDDSFVIVK